MERCPHCNARIKEAGHCSRCKADLTYINAAELGSRAMLSKAFQAVVDGRLEQAVVALLAANALKKNRWAEILQGFLIKQHCRHVINLLAEKKLLSAKQQLYRIRGFQAYSPQLRRLNGFVDYLISRQSPIDRELTD